MTTLEKVSPSPRETLTPVAVDRFERPSSLEAAGVLMPGLILGTIGVYLSLSGRLGGPEGFLGGRKGPLGKVDGMLGALLFGALGLCLGIAATVLLLSLITKGKRRRYWRRTLLAYIYLSPSVAVMGVFTFIAIIYALYVSLHKWGIAGAAKAQFIGLQNYQAAMLSEGFRRTEFWKSLANTFWLTLGSIPFQIILALIVAVLLFRKMRGVGAYRTIFFLPYVTATIALAEVWVWVFSRGQSGLVNNVLGLLGIARQGWLMEHRGIFELLAGAAGITLPNWAHGPSQALVVVMMFSIWKYFGFSLVILLAGLANIDPELYEAARIDGANAWDLFRRITIPLLSPSLYFVTLIASIGSLRSFDTIYQLTIRASAGSGPGGPLDTTETLVIYVFNQFYRDTYLGYGSALALILFMIILIITLVQQRVLGRRVFYA